VNRPLQEGGVSIGGGLGWVLQTMDNDRISYIGSREVWGGQRPFGLEQRDRRQHLYFIGKSGTGKSALLRNLVMQDILAGEGVAVLDPHGDLAEELLDCIPPSRIDDTIYLDPADHDHPIPFNLLRAGQRASPHLVASGIVGACKSIWRDSWGPRMEYILYAAVAALLECDNVSLLGIQRMLIDERYRQWVIRQVKDPMVRAFWEREFASYDRRYLQEAIAPIQNKVGQLLMAAPLRNILGQVKNKIDIVLDSFHADVVAPFLQRRGFFALGHYESMDIHSGRWLITPVVERYRLLNDGQRTSLTPDPYNGETVKALNKEPFQKYGCEVELMGLAAEAESPQIVERNYRMLTPENIAELERNEKVLRLEEKMIAFLMMSTQEVRKQLIDAQTGQSHEGTEFRVVTRRAEEMVSIAWEFKKKGNPQALNVRGYRITGGFHHDALSETSNGVCVIDSRANGSTVESLEPGETYYYTMFLRSGRGELSDPIRFSIRIPTAAQICRMNDRGQPKSNKRDAEIERMIATLETEKQKRDALRAYEQKSKAEIKSMNLPPDQEREELEALEAAVEQARATFL
jgi:hypothetical protein